MSGAARWAQNAAKAALVVALGLIGLKTWAYWATGAVTMLSSLIDSCLDGGASLVTLLAVYGARRPADDEHRFGHGKLEPLAGLAQTGFILGSASILLLQAIQRFITPQPVQAADIGIGVSIVAMVITLVLVLFQRWVLARAPSLAVEGDHLHYLSDLLTNGLTLLGFWIGDFFALSWLDPVLGLFIGGVIVRSALKIGWRAYQGLMDREAPDGVRRQIIDILKASSGFLGVHDLRTRESGPDLFIQFHLEFPDTLTLIEVHRIAQKVEDRLQTLFPQAQILIHQDPVSLVKPERRNGAIRSAESITPPAV